MSLFDSQTVALWFSKKTQGRASRNKRVLVASSLMLPLLTWSGKLIFAMMITEGNKQKGRVISGWPCLLGIFFVYRTSLAGRVLVSLCPNMLVFENYLFSFTVNIFSWLRSEQERHDLSRLLLPLAFGSIRNAAVPFPVPIVVSRWIQSNVVARSTHNPGDWP